MTDNIKKWWHESKTWQHFLLGAFAVLLLFLLVSTAIKLYHYEKILPGVKARGEYIGGLTKEQAIKKLDDKTNKYLVSTVSYQLNDESGEIRPADIGISFDNRAVVASAFRLGREGWFLQDLAVQSSLIFGNEDLMQLNVDKDKFSSFLIELNNKASKPSQNAKFIIDNGNVIVEGGKSGKKMDIGQSLFQISREMSDTNKRITVSTIDVAPSRSSEALIEQQPIVSRIAQSPVNLKYQDKAWEISQQQIIDWLYVDSQEGPINKDILNNYYGLSTKLGGFKLDKQALANYLNSISKDINSEPVNSKLSISSGNVVAVTESADGYALDMEKAMPEIDKSIMNGGPSRSMMLPVVRKRAEIRSDNIKDLGIKELIGEGVSYFPGSTPERLQNIQVGTNRYNGVVLRPGEVFSFGEILGDVGPAQGYAESKVILDGRQEFQYGGGLCQVSSTVFRAALNAGLPILERVNHSFQVSYYTQPYGVPGVDATIYYPAVDFKFKNDTNNYILVQPELNGTTLYFRLYGTKEKEGQIRGPFFDFGSLDPNQPSQTTFYRDVIIDGRVAKTDTFKTYYKSALDFPASN